MKSRFIRLVASLCLVWLSVSICGCALGSKGVQMDSTSRMPFFNFELKERKKKSDGPDFRSVQLDKGSKSRIGTVGRNGGGVAIETATLPRKSSLALPTTDQALSLDSTRDEPGELDFR